MSKIIRIRTVLYCCDGVQVFDAVDAIGRRYVGLWVEDLPDCGQRYLVVGVSPESLWRFRRGEIDLRSLIEDRAETDWFTVEGIQGEDASLPLVPLSPGRICPPPAFCWIAQSLSRFHFQTWLRAVSSSPCRQNVNWTRAAAPCSAPVGMLKWVVRV